MKAVEIGICASFVLLTAGCSIGGDGDVSAEPPTCSQLSQLLESAKTQFSTLKTGPLISSGSLEYWKSKISIPSADRCIIRNGSSGEIRYVCTWDFGNDRRAMGAFYRKLAERLTSCVGDVRVYRDDPHGYTSVDLVPTGSLDELGYAVFAHYERLPVDVAFNIKTR